MKNYIKKIVTSLIVAFGLCAQASATIITDLYGDKDGLGIGVADGEAFDWNLVTADDPADAGTITDAWNLLSNRTWSHTYDLTGLGPIISGDLEIFTGGLGFNGQSSLFLDNVFIGLLTDGDGFNGGDGENRGRLDIFDLGAFIPLLNGADTLRVETVDFRDIWALDYSELTLETTESVPEPTILSLVALGFIGMGFLGRRRRT